MALDNNIFQLTHLLQAAWQRLGQTRRFAATGGSTTTIINTDWALGEEPTYEDDDPAILFGTAVIAETTDGAAPEGEMGMITDYDAESTTATMDAVGAAVGSGDKFVLVSPLFPLEDSINAVNVALRNLGQLEQVYTGITLTAGQTEYTLPNYISEKPIRVRVQTVQDSDDNQWQIVDNVQIIPQAVGTQWKLVVPTLTTDMTLEVLYRARHPTVSAFDDEISPMIDPELAIRATLVELLQWYNNQLGGTNQYFLQRENKAIADLDNARATFPIQHMIETITGMPHWKRRSEYVPGTSDLMQRWY